MTSYQIDLLKKDIILLEQYITKLKDQQGSEERIKKLTMKLKYLTTHLEAKAA